MVQNTQPHTFHVPVMGLSFSIDTPVKVAHFGINSVISIVQDSLIESMREFYSKQIGEAYIHIPETDIAHRSKRITAYLDLIKSIVNTQINKLKTEPFEKGMDIVKYFEMLPEKHAIKNLYNEMTLAIGNTKVTLQNKLRNYIKAGAIDVNIMTKVDKVNYDTNNKKLPIEYNDALAALKGFSDSNLNSSIIFSAGLNPKLFSYLETFPDFYPDDKGNLNKKIILKVSDYRSASIQGKFLAKKGLWVSEFRIESGLNCGGHAFPTQGFLLGPILEEFKTNRQSLNTELLNLCNQALKCKGRTTLTNDRKFSITVQGGIGTHKEDSFLRLHYGLESTGWGSPFLLVPEVTNVDTTTLKQLVHAEKSDYFLSASSPLGLPFSNFKKSSSETQRKTRINIGKPGAPCYLKHLVSNTEFTQAPICLASRTYQYKKIKSLNKSNCSTTEYKREYENTTSKDCLCMGLASSVLLKHKIEPAHKLKAVTICPSQNLAYFSNIFSLKEMTEHIYGKENLLNNRKRSHMFINELVIYFDFMKEEIQKSINNMSESRIKYFDIFKENLLNGINYYKTLIPKIKNETEEFKENMQTEIDNLKQKIIAFHIPEYSALSTI